MGNVDLYLFVYAMEIIRRHTGYAVRALVKLASTDSDVVPCRELAEVYVIPRSFAYKILKKLAKGEIVASFVGSPGGFRLRKDISKISLYDIVEAVQGSISVAKCILERCEYRRKSNCPISAEWRKLQNSIVGFLKQTTLQKILCSCR
jgi:Rrf2 family protein